MSAEKKPTLLQNKLWPAVVRVPPLPALFIIPLFQKTPACEPRPHSPSLSPSLWLRIGFSHSTGTWITPIRLGRWEYPPASTHLLLAVSPARRSTDRPDRDDGEENALRGSIRWDAHSACFPPPPTTHTYGFSPHPSSPSPPRYQPPTPPHTHIYARHPLSGPVRNSGGRRIACSWTSFGGVHLLALNYPTDAGVNGLRGMTASG